MRRSLVAYACFGPLLVAAGAAALEREADRLVVTLHGGAQVSDPVVRVRDIALVQGGSSALRERVGGLDVTELRPEVKECPITREQVYFRLLLAGVDKGSVRMSGAAHLTVQLKPAPKPVASDPATPGGESPVLIKPRDLVRLVAKIGAVNVSARGEALQDGRLGQAIRVRNIASNKVVTGRVADRDIVLVDY